MVPSLHEKSSALWTAQSGSCPPPPPCPDALLLPCTSESLLIRILLSLLSLLLPDDDPESHEFMRCRAWPFDTPDDMRSLTVQHCGTCSVSNPAFTKRLAYLEIREVGTCGSSLTSSFPTCPNLGSTFLHSPRFRLRFAFTLARVRARAGVSVDVPVALSANSHSAGWNSVSDSPPKLDRSEISSLDVSSNTPLSTGNADTGWAGQGCSQTDISGVHAPNLAATAALHSGFKTFLRLARFSRLSLRLL